MKKEDLTPKQKEKIMKEILDWFAGQNVMLVTMDEPFFVNEAKETILCEINEEYIFDNVKEGNIF